MTFLDHVRKYFRNRLIGASSGLAETRASTWIGMVSAIIGGFIGLQTYSLDVAKKVDGRVEKTFDMITLYNGSALIAPRTNVLAYVHARRECDARLINNALTDEDFVRVIEFYDLVHACVAAGLCDQDTAIQFFSPHANFQWPVLTRTIGLMKESSVSVRSDPNFGIGLEAFASTPVPADVCEGNF